MLWKVWDPFFVWFTVGIFEFCYCCYFPLPRYFTAFGQSCEKNKPSSKILMNLQQDVSHGAYPECCRYGRKGHIFKQWHYHTACQDMNMSSRKLAWVQGRADTKMDGCIKMYVCTSKTCDTFSKTKLLIVAK